MERMRKLTVMVVDDERESINYLCGLLGQLGLSTETIITETDALRAFRYIRDHRVDLLFLDVEMPGLNGLSLLEALEERPPVILTTAHPEYAMEAYRLSLPECIPKPVALPRLIKAVDRTVGLGNTKKTAGDDYVFLRDKEDGVQLKIYFNDIIYVECHHNEITLHLPYDKLVSRMTMKDFLALLPPEDFMQVHRSYSVSMDKIIKFFRKTSKMYMIGNRGPIPLSDTYREEFLRVFDPEPD
ncbi:LytR/AlgR family response regulator transcription factor [Parapedobacter sp. DT-150]|uniref:LytR/AlgR family response regulator transcription factor n=1 Tax=Parapedobacter sp. DT-150 TaxID=3396162 RepID=UPI003F1C21EB